MLRPRKTLVSPLRLAMLIFTLLLTSTQVAAVAAPDPAAQQTYVIPFSGAIYVTVPNPGSPAVPATCPASAPISCASIGQTNYCCPSGDYCAWNGGQVGCCPSGSTCSGWANGYSGGNNGAWQPTTGYCANGGTWNAGGWCENPAPVQTVYVAGGGAGGGAYYQATTTYQANSGQYTQGYAQGQYCSTLYADGPGLPTTRPGQCGTILILQASATRVTTVGMIWTMFMMMAGMQLLWLRPR